MRRPRWSFPCMLVCMLIGSAVGAIIAANPYATALVGGGIYTLFESYQLRRRGY